MRTVGLVVGVLALALCARADDIYRWTDSSGNVHYSNTPSGRTGPSTVESTPGEPRDEAGAAPAEAREDGETARAGAPGSDADAYSAGASLRRNALERDLRATGKRLRDIDARLATLARARTAHAHGSAATGGVGTVAVDVRSEEEKALATEREQLGQHAVEIKNDAATLRKEVTTRLGETPAWWIDPR